MHPGSFCYRQFTDRPDGVNRSCIHITRLQTYQCGIIQWWYLLRNDPSLFISGYPYQVVHAKTSKYQGLSMLTCTSSPTMTRMGGAPFIPIDLRSQPFRV